jgi:hypothetical protein
MTLIYFSIDYPGRLALVACALVAYFLFVRLLRRWLG